MFVPTEFLEAGAPAVGETVDFEVRLSDDFRLVNGRGEIAWRRGGADGGLGVRFLDLDEPSKRLVARLVSNFVKDGGEPFDVEAGAAEASVEVEQAAEVEQTPEVRTPVEPEHLGAIEADELFATPELPQVEVPEELPLVEEASAEPLAGASEPPEETTMPELGTDVEEDERQRLQVPDLELEASPPELLEPLLPPAAVPAVKESAPIRPVISRDIARVAEELSGRTPVPPVEMPTEEERTAVYSGAATPRGGRSWRTFALASIAGVALGVAAWFLAGDSLKSLFGLTPDEPVATASAPAPGERQGARTEPGAGRSTEASPPPAVATGKAAEPREAAGAGAGRESAEVGQRAGAVAPEAAAAAASESVPTEGPVVVEAREETAAPAGSGAEVVSSATSAAQRSPSGRRATAVESVIWRAQGGATVVTIRLDGSLRSEDLEVLQLREGAPREVIKLRGISSPMVPAEVEIDSAQVVRLRSGLHEVGGRSELHLVADLARPDAKVALERPEGRTLVITFS